MTTTIMMYAGFSAVIALICGSAWYYKQPARLLVIPLGVAAYFAAGHLAHHVLDYSWVLVAIALPLIAWSARKERLVKRYALWGLCCVSAALLLASRFV